MNNSEHENTKFEPDFPEVKGVGSVKVDGNTVYDSADELSEAVKEVDDFLSETLNAKINATVDGAVSGGAATPSSDATWASTEVAADASVASNSAGAAHAAGTASATSNNTSASHYPNPSYSPDKSSAKPLSYANKWGLWIGVILVALGTLIFLDMLSGVIPAMENIFGGHSVWRFWPLLIVLAGFLLAFSPAKSSPDPRRNDGFSLLRFSEGAFVATIGLVFLGNSLGSVSWFSWIALISFWPLLLVIAGLSMLSYALKTEWFSLIAYTVSILVLVSVASSMWTGDAALVEPFITLAEFGSFRGMDLFNIGSEVGSNFR